MCLLDEIGHARQSSSPGRAAAQAVLLLTPDPQRAAGAQGCGAVGQAAQAVSQAHGQQGIPRQPVHGTAGPHWHDLHPLQERVEPPA